MLITSLMGDNMFSYGFNLIRYYSEEILQSARNITNPKKKDIILNPSWPSVIDRNNLLFVQLYLWFNLYIWFSLVIFHHHWYQWCLGCCLITVSIISPSPLTRGGQFSLFLAIQFFHLSIMLFLWNDIPTLIQCALQCLTIFLTKNTTSERKFW